VPRHVYPALEVRGPGYEQFVVTDVVVHSDIVVNGKVTRDWASLAGGATLLSFTPPDYAPFCGSNANGAFDLNLGNGWPSDSVNNPSSGVTGPRKATVELPTAVDISAFTVASGGTCGDDDSSAVTDFKIQTKTAGGSWQIAFQGTATVDGQLHAYAPTGAADGVVQIRFIMLANNGNPDFMDVLEVGVRGSAS
jgi:extracellular elastinolytic metalloproteinase